MPYDEKVRRRAVELVVEYGGNIGGATRQLKEELGITIDYRTVRKYAIECGLNINPRGGTRVALGEDRRVLSEQQKSEIRRAYRMYGTVTMACKVLHCSPEIVSRVLREAKINPNKNIKLEERLIRG